MGSCNQFSDLSMKISEYDHDASKSEPDHISNLLKGNISKMREQIEKEGEKLLREKTPASMSGSYVEKYQECVARLYNLALSPSYKEDDLDDIFNAFKSLEKESNIQMPSQIYSLIASLHEFSEEGTDKNEN
jgi:lipoate-protein ligase A